MTIDVEDGLEADAVANGVEQIIDNYVDNALGAARRGDTITISARRTPDGIEVCVADEGPGIAEALPRLEVQTKRIVRCRVRQPSLRSSVLSPCRCRSESGAASAPPESPSRSS